MSIYDNMISGGYVMRLIGLVKRSSFPREVQDELIDSIPGMNNIEALEMEELLSMNQLDITQLSIYTNEDINKRLNWLDENEDY